MDTEREIILLSVGSASVEDPDQLACLKNAHALIPNAALVVLSDREELKGNMRCLRGRGHRFPAYQHRTIYCTPGPVLHQKRRVLLSPFRPVELPFGIRKAFGCTSDHQRLGS